MKEYSLPFSIIISSIIIAFAFRYDVAETCEFIRIYDRWTGVYLDW